MKNAVTILGARGSVGVSGAEYAKYGGATTCAVARLSGRPVVLDAGTGLMNLPADCLDAPSLPLLLTHPHVDHLLGLPLCPYVMRRGARLDVYAVGRGGLDAEAQIRRLLSPPLWPVGPERLPADIRFHDLPAEFYLYPAPDTEKRQGARDAIQTLTDTEKRQGAPIRVRTMEGVHPGGVTLLRLDCDGKSVAFLTDCTLTDALRPRALSFAADCSLLLCDGQYSGAEWPSRSGFGHSPWTAAAQFARDCGARQARVIHHDPFHTDAVLDAASEELDAIFDGCSFAREGEEIIL